MSDLLESSYMSHGEQQVYPGSTYRVKFEREEFLQLVDRARPNYIYHVKRIYFFSYDGFVMYTFKCKEEDFSIPVIEAIEFSNQPWNES